MGQILKYKSDLKYKARTGTGRGTRKDEDGVRKKKQNNKKKIKKNNSFFSNI